MPGFLDSKLSTCFFSWYFGLIRRDVAEKYLMHPLNGCGSFLIRDSVSMPGDYSLSMKYKKEVLHFRVLRSVVGGFYLDHTMTFQTISELVQYCKTHDSLVQDVYLKAPCLILEIVNLPKKANKALEIDKKSICLVKKLGAGQFGEVWLGMYNDTTEVAVKILQRGAMVANELLKEAASMKKLKHPKLAQFHGVCTKEEPIYIITEYFIHGSLLECLRGGGCSLKLHRLIDIGAQVAAGMAYLEEQNFIHQDLAARNILVGKNLVCKVADFGLAHLIDKDIYGTHTPEKFPIKWTAPEALLHNCFTIKSDVWSFGILLYELITYGHVPYPGMTNPQVLEAVVKGYRMPCPDDCPELLHEIMRECWRDDRASRPTFETLQWKMEDFFFTDTGPTHRDPASIL